MDKINSDKVIIRFAGDSGDGIQIIGNQLSNTSVMMSGNDIYTFVDFPSEIRAPSGSLSGVSGFQLAISSKKLHSIEDKVDLLVAFNPAALRTSIELLKENTIIIVDSDSFNDKNLKRANFQENPLENNFLNKYKILKIPISSLTYECVKEILTTTSKAKRCKNFFVLGVVCWLYDRKIETISEWLKKKFKSNEIYLANKEALKAGYNYGNNLEIYQNQISIPPSHTEKSNMMTISGNKAFSIGAITSSLIMNMPLFSASYPITPASDILHELSLYSSENIKILQSEDEIAAINSSIGASFGGALSFTFTSGPGLDLIQEGVGLAIMSELPVLIIDIQRSGPSTGIPTKSEQTDLMSSIFGRHGESHVVVISPDSPVDCFWTIIEGFILSIFYSGPVIILSDANLANSSELWQIPEIEYIKKELKIDLEDIEKTIKKNNSLKKEINKDIKRLSCIGGLEKDLNGNVSHDSENHWDMTKKRYEKFESIKKKFKKLNIFGKNSGNNLIISWGSVCGVVKNIYENYLNEEKNLVSLLCLRYLNPLPEDLEKIINSFKKIIIIEENLGQLAFIIKSKYLINVISINQVSGKPFETEKLKNIIIKEINL